MVRGKKLYVPDRGHFLVKKHTIILFSQDLSFIGKCSDLWSPQLANKQKLLFDLRYLLQHHSNCIWNYTPPPPTPSVKTGKLNISMMIFQPTYIPNEVSGLDSIASHQSILARQRSQIFSHQARHLEYFILIYFVLYIKHHYWLSMTSYIQ